MKQKLTNEELASYALALIDKMINKEHVKSVEIVNTYNAISNLVQKANEADKSKEAVKEEVTD